MLTKSGGSYNFYWFSFFHTFLRQSVFLCTCNDTAVTFLEQFLIFMQFLLLLKMCIFVFMLINNVVHKEEILHSSMGTGLNFLN